MRVNPGQFPFQLGCQGRCQLLYQDHVGNVLANLGQEVREIFVVLEQVGAEQPQGSGSRFWGREIGVSERRRAGAHRTGEPPERWDRPAVAPGQDSGNPCQPSQTEPTGPASDAENACGQVRQQQPKRPGVEHRQPTIAAVSPGEPTQHPDGRGGRVEIKDSSQEA